MILLVSTVRSAVGVGVEIIFIFSLLSGEVHYNMDRTTWDVRNLLEVFSREFTHKDFCLAHLFTDIKFEGGILGSAYVGLG